MLGAVGSAGQWRWSGAGKHPVAKDYVRLGHPSPFADGFADWVKNGYRSLKPREKRPVSEFRSWRFWARGFGKEGLACGVVRDSNDAFGRQYPFLLLGNGPLTGWESQWDLLPLACDEMWTRMESLCLASPVDCGHLEEEILRGIRPPLPEWSDHAVRRGSLEEDGETYRAWSSSPEGNFSRDPGKTDIMIDLEQGPTGDPSTASARWSRFLKDRLPAVPSASFLGGAHRFWHLALFLRPLNRSDFVRLWSVSQEGAQDGATTPTA